jgi:hypothetical protein
MTHHPRADPNSEFVDGMSVGEYVQSVYAHGTEGGRDGVDAIEVSQKVTEVAMRRRRSSITAGVQSQWATLPPGSTGQ